MAKLHALAGIRPHYWCGVILFLLIASMVVQPSQDARAFTLAPIIAVFTGFVAFYGLEYDAFAKNAAKAAPGEKPATAARPEAPRPATPRTPAPWLENYP